MCFNMSLAAERTALEKEFQVLFESAEQELFFDGGLLPCYNASGFSHPFWPVITTESPAVFTAAKWGLVPAWVREREQALQLQNKTLNARSETIWKLPSFRHAASSGQRCLVPVDGFYEPHHHEGVSYPFYLHMRHRIFSLGGIYDVWQGPESGRIYISFSILTCPAEGLVSRIHNNKQRMPLIIGESLRSAWLDRSLADDEVREIIAHASGDELQAHPVSRNLYRRTEDYADPVAAEPVAYGIEAVDQLASS
ncbi:MAG: SOS response-associated peptidase [Spirochaetota bacterium]